MSNESRIVSTKPVGTSCATDVASKRWLFPHLEALDQQFVGGDMNSGARYTWLGGNPP